MRKFLTRLGWAFLVAVLVVVIIIVAAYFLGRMSVPPQVKALEWFSNDVNPFCGQTTVVNVGNDGKDHVMYRIVLKKNYDKYNNKNPSENAIENIYIVCAFEQDSVRYLLESKNFAICTDDPTEDNPEFAAFLKDNRWGEEYVAKSEPVVIHRPSYKSEDEYLNAAALAKAEAAAGKKTGESEEYRFSLINYDCNGKYLYTYFDKQTSAVVFYKITVTQEEAAAYGESGATDISQGVETAPFDPYGYKEILQELSQFFR